MRLAFFTSIVPDGNPTTGFEIANAAILESLRELGHSVTVFGFRLPRQLASQAEDVIVLETRELENASAGSGQKLAWLAQAIRRGLPYAAAKLADFSALELERLVGSQSVFDGYVLNSYQMAAAFPQLLEKPYVYVAHNVEHRSAMQNADAAQSFFTRRLYRRDAKLLRSLETRICAKANHVWAFSEEDLDAHGCTADTGGLLPLYVAGAGQADPSVSKQYDIGLIGTWSWQPNFVGLKWFLEQVLPKLPQDLSISIAGSLPDAPLKTDERVTFLGRVESAEAFLDSVYVVPLISRDGTGVQLKTIEAFQAGRACVATASSLRGIDELPENCLNADDADSFSEALIALINSAKSNSWPTVDGAQFYQKQRDALKQELQRGLGALA